MVKRGKIAVVTTLLFIGFVMLLLCGTSQGNGKATISEQKVIRYLEVMMLKKEVHYIMQLLVL